MVIRPALLTFPSWEGSGYLLVPIGPHSMDITLTYANYVIDYITLIQESQGL